ncbi:MAG: hypothetical protein AAF804_00495, partial [Bacteroidota bacterium]
MKTLRLVARWRNSLKGLHQAPAEDWAWFMATVWAFFCGLRMFKDLDALNAAGWMNILLTSEFTNWSELWAYLSELRTGIPPLLFVVEVLIEWTFQPHGLTIWLYD